MIRNKSQFEALKEKKILVHGTVDNYVQEKGQYVFLKHWIIFGLIYGGICIYIGAIPVNTWQQFVVLAVIGAAILVATPKIIRLAVHLWHGAWIARVAWTDWRFDNRDKKLKSKGNALS